MLCRPSANRLVVPFKKSGPVCMPQMNVLGALADNQLTGVEHPSLPFASLRRVLSLLAERDRKPIVMWGNVQKHNRSLVEFVNLRHNADLPFNIGAQCRANTTRPSRPD